MATTSTPKKPSRGSPPAGVGPQGGPMGPQGNLKPTNQMGPKPAGAEPPPPPPVTQVQLPPENTYPCGCAWPGVHKQDCMWSLWEQMRDNYLQTRELMGKFMGQANMMQESAREKVTCECPAGCHGTDLGKAMGLQQMTGVTVPWGSALVAGGGIAGLPPQQQQSQSYSVENEARRQMEEQRRIKNTWTQFFSLFDMALDMANDVSKDRWEQNRRRKERQRLEREQRLEELRKERLERQKGSKPEPPPQKDKATDKKDVKGKENEKADQRKEDKSKAQADDKPKSSKDTPKASEDSGKGNEPAANDDTVVADPEPTGEVTENPEEKPDE